MNDRKSTIQELSATLSELLPSKDSYLGLFNSLRKLTHKEQVLAFRVLILSDLYYLIRYVFNRTDFDDDWLFQRCREVQQTPNGMLDLWAREHRKSTIITFALTIQDILKNPDITVGIFSHTRPIAKSFLRQIKRELEGNLVLKELFPDVLYQEPHRESPKWSEDDGIIVKRSTNPKEATVEAWGLVDGQPIGKHFHLMVYDDLVTRESVNTPEMIAKVTEAWELSLNLASGDGVKRYIGTRYHFNDTYAQLIQRGSAKPRIHPATKDGSVHGEPVFMTREQLAEKRRDMGSYIFASQMLLNPLADEAQGFRYEWVRHYESGLTGEGLNKYILVDPANEKKKTSDYSVFWVVGLGSDGNYYCLDVIRDRVNLTERGNILFNLHRRWSPLKVGYEKYSMQSDIEHMKTRMSREHYHFDIVELGGNLAKSDRIRRLIPLFEQGKVYLPLSIYKTNYEGKTEDLVQVFIEHEYKAFPVSNHDDMLDCLARICDPGMELLFPMTAESKEQRYDRRPNKYGTWMSR